MLFVIVSTRARSATRYRMAAEMASAPIAVDLAEFERCSLAETFPGHFQVRPRRSWARFWAMVLAIEATTGYDALVQGEGSAVGKGVALHDAAIREALLEPEN